VKHILKRHAHCARKRRRDETRPAGLACAKKLYDQVAARGWEDCGTQALYRLYTSYENITDFRKRVLAREWLCGTFLNLGSPMTIEIAGLAGFDWILIDHEHGPGGEDTLLHQLHAASATPAFPSSASRPTRRRVSNARSTWCERRDAPYVSTAAEARAAVAAVRYPPHGIRGVAKFNRGAGFGGDFEEYYLHGHERLLTVVQIETAEAVDNIDEIAAVDARGRAFRRPDRPQL